MLQTVDDAMTEQERAGWIWLLSGAPLAMLEAWISGIEAPAFTWLRRPEVGLVMVEGRIGNEGARFNLGELTVTRCALKLASGEAGVGYVRGRSMRHAELAAIGDALMQRATGRPLMAGLLQRLRERRGSEAAAARRRARATRVEFFTVARGED